MTFLIVEHEVKNAKAWKKVFDAHQDVRTRFGLRNDRTYQALDNPNQICVISEGTGDKLQAFINDVSLRDAMQEAGVVGEPQIQIVDELTATH